MFISLLLLLLLLLRLLSPVTAHQAPLSLGFSRKNTRVGCHFSNA